MKPREPRRNVLIPARMRVGAAWNDAAILNLSSRGLLLHSCQTPARGTYVEVRRGCHVIVARVIWVSGERFGVCSQDRLPVDAIISRPDISAQDSTGRPAQERRATPRPTDNRHDTSRLRGRLMEFASLVIIAGFAAAGIYNFVAPTLTKPLAQISAALGG